MLGIWKMVLENGIKVTSNYKRINNITEYSCIIYYLKVFEIIKLSLSLQLKQNLWKCQLNLNVNITKLLHQFILINKPKHWLRKFNTEKTVLHSTINSLF